MAVLKYTADELIASVRARAGLPNSGVSGTDDATILRHLNEELLTRFAPGVKKLHEEYFVVVERSTLTALNVRIPARAMGQALRDVMYVDTIGNRSVLNAIHREDLNRYNETSSDPPSHYYVEGNRIRLVAGSVSGQLELSYFMRPGQLVLVAETRLISAVDTATKTITLTAVVPSGWINGTTFDIHSPHSGAELKLWDITGESVSTNQIQFTEAIDGSTYGTQVPVAGDYVVLAGEAALPALPRELHPALAQAGVLRVHEALGDHEGAQASRGSLQEMMAAAGYLLDSRIEGKPPRIINRNSIFFGGRTHSFGTW